MCSSVQLQWTKLSQQLNLPESIQSEVWETINLHYGEYHRYYHTLTHIEHMLSLTTEYSDVIVDKIAVDLAVFFHDIIYDPKSGTNEEDSAKLFDSLLCSYMDSSLCAKVANYIIETKQHKVADSIDSDLKYFIDIDMFILGTERPQYAEYCRNIRKEYIFVDESVYCQKRGEFLRNLLKSEEKVFATNAIGVLRGAEQRARENMEWECNELEAGRLIA